MLGDDVYDALACFVEILQRVLGFVEGSDEAYDEEWGVMVDDLGVAEGGEIC